MKSLDFWTTPLSSRMRIGIDSDVVAAPNVIVPETGLVDLDLMVGYNVG